MSLIQAIILAIIEGLTEFLPISSTGHMIIASSIMGISTESFTKTFTVAIQFGAILSVVALYWKRFFQSIEFYIILFMAFIPAAIFGLALGSFLDRILERVDVVGFALLIGGFILLYVDKWFKHNEEPGNTSSVGIKQAFLVGCFQCLAILLPGLSRSAATIIGGLTQKLNRKTAAEFSFFLAVPTMFAATVYKLFKFLKNGNGFELNEISLLVVGNLVAFVVAWVAIRSFINYLTQHGFKVFGYYRILVGAVILTLYYSGYQFSML